MKRVSVRAFYGPRYGLLTTRSTSGPPFLAGMLIPIFAPDTGRAGFYDTDEFLIASVHEIRPDFVEHTPDRFLGYANHAG